MVSATPKNAHKIYGWHRVPLYANIQFVIGYGNFYTENRKKIGRLGFFLLQLLAFENLLCIFIY